MCLTDGILSQQSSDASTDLLRYDFQTWRQRESSKNRLNGKGYCMRKANFAVLAILTALTSFTGIGRPDSRSAVETIQRQPEAQKKTSDRPKEILVNGTRRTYILHVPPEYKKEKHLPLVIVLHGGGGNAGNMIRRTGFSEKADRENFVVVYPNGSGRSEESLLTFNAIGCCAYAMRNKVDDVAFVSKLIDVLTAEYGIDKKRVYVTGFSNGAMIASYLAASISNKIAAVAPVSGAIFASSPKPIGTMAVLLIHGTADTAVPYDGGMSKRPVIIPSQSEPYRSVFDGAKYWAENSNCKGTPETKTSGIVTTERFVGCAAGSEVEVISIKGGVHAWPGGNNGRGAMDAPSVDLNATDAIWDFFKKHHR